MQLACCHLKCCQKIQKWLLFFVCYDCCDPTGDWPALHKTNTFTSQMFFTVGVAHFSTWNILLLWYLLDVIKTDWNRLNCLYVTVGWLSSANCDYVVASWRLRIRGDVNIMKVENLLCLSAEKIDDGCRFLLSESFRVGCSASIVASLSSCSVSLSIRFTSVPTGQKCWPLVCSLTCSGAYANIIA